MLPFTPLQKAYKSLRHFCFVLFWVEFWVTLSDIWGLLALYLGVTPGGLSR